MGLSRNVLLWASENQYLLRHVPNYGFVRKALKRFMPGEDADDAIGAARLFMEDRIPTVFTYLGESVTDISEADAVRDHYLSLLDRISTEELDIEVSVKLTQLGLDLSAESAYENVAALAARAGEFNNVVWIDMERSNYVDASLDLYRKLKKDFPNTGVCLQSYLRRTKKDAESLLEIAPLIRLVKGAYNEPADIAFPDKGDVDRNYYELSMTLLKGVRDNGARVAFGTHDTVLHGKIIRAAGDIGLSKEKLEFQMLYGIKPSHQRKLAGEGYNIRVLISYGKAWYKWYVRRLAERPANVGFVIRNMFSS